MKVSILSAVALAGFAIAAPLYSRQPQTVRIELQIEEDTFIQENIPIGAVVHTDDNPRLAEGMSARVVSPEGIRCQAFGENDEPLGEPFDEERVQFAAEPIPIGAYFCSPKENGDDEDCEDEREQGNARIQLETSSNTFVQKEVPIGKEVSTKDNARTNRGISATVATTSNGKDQGAVTCQAFQDGKPLGEPFSQGKTVDLAENRNAPEQIDAFRCDAD